jgi:hypothetical protein
MIAEGCANSSTPSAQTELNTRKGSSLLIIQSYESGLGAIRTANPNVKLRLDRGPRFPDGRVLLVDYPAANNDPAGRDVWCDAENRDWTSGRAISFQVRPDHAIRLSVSFLDRNGVAYTSWTELQDGTWQTVRISFDQIRPNPYFQPPGAAIGAPIDISEVMRIGFAPHDQAAGRLAISRFVVVD